MAINNERIEAYGMLTRFFSAAEKDPRISIAHIGLFCTLVCLWQKQADPGPLHAFSREVMFFAKISSSATYVKLLGDLHQCKYLRYEPSYYRRRPSRIFLSGEALF